MMNSHDIATKYKRFYKQGQKLVPLTRDSMFKKILTRHPEFLKVLMHHILELPLTHIGDIRYRDKELLPEYSGKKVYRLDLLADVMITDVHTGRTDSHPVCVEMHSTSPSYVLKKVSAYAHRLFGGQLEPGSGSGYNQLKDVYCLGIFKEKIPGLTSSDYIHRLPIVNLDEPRDRMPGAKYWLIELAKFNKQFTELSTELDKILYFIKHADIIMQDPDQALHYIQLGGIMAKVINEALDYSNSKEYQHILEYVEKERAERDTHIAQGKAEGIAEERARGTIKLKQVAAESEARGEEKAKISLARELLASDFDPAEVARLTKLDISTIRELRSAS